MKEKQHRFYCEAASVSKDGFGLINWTWASSPAELSPYSEDRGEAGSLSSSSRAVLRITEYTRRREGKVPDAQEESVCPPYPRSEGLCGKVRPTGTGCQRAGGIPGHSATGTGSPDTRAGELLLGAGLGCCPEGLWQVTARLV